LNNRNTDSLHLFDYFLALYMVVWLVGRLAFAAALVHRPMKLDKRDKKKYTEGAA